MQACKIPKVSKSEKVEKSKDNYSDMFITGKGKEPIFAI